MPTYEYQCTDCNNQFEIWQEVGEAAPACPECGSDVRKVFHPPRVIFKGSGFYVTDLRAEKEAKSAKKDKPAETASSETTKPEPAKTETKTESTSSSTDSKPATPAAA